MKTRKYSEQEMKLISLFAKNNYKQDIVDETRENAILKYSFYQDNGYFLKITPCINNIQSQYGFYFRLSKADFFALRKKFKDANL